MKEGGSERDGRGVCVFLYVLEKQASLALIWTACI